MSWTLNQIWRSTYLARCFNSSNFDYISPKYFFQRLFYMILRSIAFEKIKKFLSYQNSLFVLDILLECLAKEDKRSNFSIEMRRFGSTVTSIGQKRIYGILLRFEITKSLAIIPKTLKIVFIKTSGFSFRLNVTRKKIVLALQKSSHSMDNQ